MPATPAATSASQVDWSGSEHRDQWLHHPVVGDPSWDSFVREPGNPICTGAKPYEWPVNGFLFRDPPTGRWYCYVGLYARGYFKHPTVCRLYRQQDGGEWQDLGIVLKGDPAAFDGDGTNPGHTPDVSVVFADGRYHMVYDWGRLVHRVHGGLAYARSDKPEGPWRRAERPITNEAHMKRALFGRYVRTYAGTLLRRAKDWLILTDMSTSQNAGGTWALAALTANAPEGPYSGPELLLCPQFDTFLPIHLEYYPAFAHKGFAYVPGTSVAKNRSFQALFRAPLEEAHKPAAWQVYQHGSVWHDEPVTNEALGIWGQTLSGQVDPSGRLRVMFPCKDRQDLGTINLAGRDWNRPYRDGFVLSAPRAPAVAILQRQFLDFQLRLKCSAWPAGGAGATGWGVSWQCRGPVGTGGLTADSRLSALMRRSKLVLRVLPRAWRLLRINAAGAERLLAQGQLAGAVPPEGVDVCIRRAGTKVRIDLGGTDLWSGQIDQPLPGRLELEAQAGTILKVSRFQTTGQARAGTLFFLGADAVAGAAEGGRWKEVKDPSFRFGAGYQTTSGRAKWNYYGGGFKLHCPRGPAYGACKVIVDGKTAAERIELNAPQRVASAALLDKPLPTGLHAVVILPVSGTVAIDCLEVQEP